MISRETIEIVMSPPRYPKHQNAVCLGGLITAWEVGERHVLGSCTVSFLPITNPLPNPSFPPHRNLPNSFHDVLHDAYSDFTPPHHPLPPKQGALTRRRFTSRVASNIHVYRPCDRGFFFLFLSRAASPQKSCNPHHIKVTQSHVPNNRTRFPKGRR